MSQMSAVSYCYIKIWRKKGNFRVTLFFSFSSLHFAKYLLTYINAKTHMLRFPTSEKPAWLLCEKWDLANCHDKITSFAFSRTCINNNGEVCFFTLGTFRFLIFMDFFFDDFSILNLICHIDFTLLYLLVY